MGTVLLTGFAVVILGSFGVVVLTSLSDTADPPTASFALDADVGGRAVNVTFVDGTSFALSGARVSIQLNGTDVTGTTWLRRAADPGRFAAGDVLQVNLTDAAPTPGAGSRLDLLVADTASNAMIGRATRELHGESAPAPFLANAPAFEGARIEPAVAVVDGASLANLSIDLSSSFGLALIDSVWVDLTPVGGEEEVFLHDDGRGADEHAGDGVYTAQFVLEDYPFTSNPAVETVTLDLTIRDILGHDTRGTVDIAVSAPQASKVVAGSTYRDVPSSTSIGYLNLTNFTFRDATRLGGDQIELRVSDLSDSTRSWTALVSFEHAGCGGVPSVTEVVLTRDGESASATYAPASGCFAIDAGAHVNINDPPASVNASDVTNAWVLTGDPAVFAYVNASIGALNEAKVTYFGDAAAGTLAAVGLGQADLVWGTYTDATTTVPGAPFLTATGGNGQVALAWSPPGSAGGTPITAYRIYSGPSSGSLTLLATTGANTTFVASGLVNGATYYFAVAAVNAEGEGAPSNGASATPATTPSAPGSLVATRGNGSALLSWTAAPNGGTVVSNHKVYVGTASGATVFTALTGSGSATSTTVTGLANGVTYYFQVTAVNAVGEGAPSNEASATPATVPEPPFGLAAAPGAGSVTLTWTQGATGGSALTGHAIHMGTTAGAETLLATTGSGANTSFVVRGLVNGATYHFRVSSENGLGTSALSGRASAVPSLVPDAPATLVATPGNATVALSWTPAFDGGSPLTGYDIWMGTSSGSATLLATTSSGTNTSFVVNGLANGQERFFNVTARNANGVGASSNEASATPSGTPNPPSGLVAAPGDQSVALSWTPGSTGGSPLTGYEIWMGTSSGGQTLLATTSSGANTTFLALGLSNGVAYHFYVVALNDNGASAASNAASATPVAGTTVPTAPSGLVATRGNGSVVLSWTAPASDGGSALEGHKVYASTASGATTYLATLGTGTTFTVSGLTNGVAYFFNVTAVNGVGESPSSNQATATPATTPHPPFGVAATRGDGSVALTWTAGADGGLAPSTFNVYAGASSGTLTLLASTGSGASTSFVANGLVNGQAYVFRVAAVNGVGESALSNEASATPAGLPGAPGSLSAARGNGTATLTWTPASTGGSALTTYKVYVGASSGTQAFLASTGSGASTSFVVTGLVNGQTYFFNVTAVNAVGEGATSAEASATPATIPNPPAGLTATRGNGSATLTWSAPSTGGSALATYKVYRGTASGTETFLASTGSGASTSFVVDGLVNGVAYFFNVTAVNGVGESATSNEATVTPATRPDPPAGLAAATGNRSVTLTWTAPATGGSALTGYKVYRGTATGTETFLVATENGASTSFAVPGLTNGVAYFFNVTAVNALGESSSSNEATATPGSVPFPPTGLTATSASATSATLSWTAPADSGGLAIERYDVYRGTVSGATTFLGTTGGPTTTFTASGLTTGTTYFFNVTAVNARGASASSGQASVVPTTPATVPSAPQGLQLTASNARVTLSWSAPATDGGSSISGYRIYRSATNGTGGMTLVAAVGTTTYADTGLSNNATYYYQVAAVNGVGEGAATSIRDATPRGIATIDCSTLVQTAGTVSCPSMQLDDAVTAELRESSGGTKILNVSVSVNMTGITGTQTLRIQAESGNAPEILLVKALNVGTGVYDTIIAIPATTTVGATWSGSIPAATYFPNGILKVRLVDGADNTAQTSWLVDYLGVVIA